MAGSTINFSVTGAGTATPATGSAVTDADGKASFSFAGDRAGDYTVTASTTYNGQTVSDTHTVALDHQHLLPRRGRRPWPAARTTSPRRSSTRPATSPTSAPPPARARWSRSTWAPWPGWAPSPCNSGENNLTLGGHRPRRRTSPTSAPAPTPAEVVKIDLTTFTRVGAITLATAVRAASARPSSTPPGTSPTSAPPSTAAAGRVVKIDLTTFTRVGAITFAVGRDHRLLGGDRPRRRLRLLRGRGRATPPPGRLVKVDLATFTRVGAVTLVGRRRTSPTSAVIDPAGDFAYLGTDQLSEPRRSRSTWATFARVGALIVTASTSAKRASLSRRPTSAVMAPDGRHAYFGTSPGSSPDPRQVIEIDLATFTRARTVTLPTGEGNLRSAVIAPDGANAYFGTATLARQGGQGGPGAPAQPGPGGRRRLLRHPLRRAR